jgi:hypothetical protein
MTVNKVKIRGYFNVVAVNYGRFCCVELKNVEFKRAHRTVR